MLLSDEPGTTTSLLKKCLEQKKHITNPISRVNECGQACKRVISFRDLDSKDGAFVCEVVCQELVAKGNGQTKKEAKKAAAMKLIEQVENSSKQTDKLEIVGEDNENLINKKSDTVVGTPDVEHKMKDKWAVCLAQLEGDDNDWVRNLAIFAFNTATGSPKYKVTQVVKDKQEMYRVLCTWNMFFLEGEGDCRSKAEQEVSMKMINKVRSVCDMKEMTNSQQSLTDPQNLNSRITVPLHNVGTHLHVLPNMVKHSYMLADNLLSGKVEQLEKFCDKAGSSSPVYSISGVSTSGCLVNVMVTCSCFKITSIGEGSSKTIAEEKAALKMIILLKQSMSTGGKEPDNAENNASVLQPDEEPVHYLAYPGHGHPLGQANVTVTSRDYQCLQIEQYLNDVIIDFYLKYLQIELFSHSPFMKRTYIFSIYFYKRLTMKPKSTSPTMSKEEGMHNNVKKWTKNVNIFENDFIVVPINDCDHWFVVIICYPALLTRQVEQDRIKQPLLLVLDSLEDGLKNSVCDNLRTYLTMEWKEKMKSSRQFTVTSMPSFCPKIPQQENMTDCGLFLLEYVESFYKEPIKNFTTPLPSMSNWFTVDKVNRKREDIAKLIRNLTIKQNKGMVISFPDFRFTENIVARKSITKEEDTVKSTTDDLDLFSNRLDLSTSSLTKPLARETIKMNLAAMPGAKVIVTKETRDGTADRERKDKELVAEREKRVAEVQLGEKNKRIKKIPEEENDQDWWCDY